MGARSRRRPRRRRVRGFFRRFLVGAIFLILLLGLAYAFDAGWIDVPGPDAKLAPIEGEGMLRVHYVDVGQGDGTIWELPDGSLVVYDCGPPAGSPAANPMVRYLQEQMGRASGSVIHALISSHGHLDHIGGCDEIFDEYRVLHVYETWYSGGDAPESYRRFLREAREEGATLHTLGEVADLPGERPFSIGDALLLPPEAVAAGVRAEILWPGEQAASWDAIAERSMVLRLTHGDVAFCFQGDVEIAQERALAERVPADACDAYLVGHHGSRYASSSEWLSRLDPEVAVVSFGDNPYGHPTSEALCRVQRAGATVYATAHQSESAVVLVSDGRSLDVPRGTAESTDHCRSEAAYQP